MPAGRGVEEHMRVNGIRYHAAEERSVLEEFVELLRVE